MPGSELKDEQGHHLLATSRYYWHSQHCMPGSQGQVAAGSSRDFDPGETMGTHEDSGLDCILDRQTMLLALGCSRPGDRLSEAIQTPSFRGDAKHRARNLEIPRCAIAHLRSGPSDHPGMTKGGLLRRFRLRSLSYGGQVAPLSDIKTPRSRGAMRPSVARTVRPGNRGRRECRCPMHPQPRVQM